MNLSHDLEEWHPDTSSEPPHLAAHCSPTAEIYDTYFHYGWPADFDKEGCRARLLELRKQDDKGRRRQMRQSEDGASDSDDEVPTSAPSTGTARPLTGGAPPRKPQKV
ncbi:hypothetical protein AAFC00_003984 [Neodothiora populina]|uniref:Uncharacterized protein n=1 Tax=Neodothiora populina TaxID=2781224 RepID=A0ABR3PI50_9PEZI